MSEQDTVPSPRPGDAEPRMWHVKLTVSGSPVEPGQVRTALERLSYERPFLLAGRYSADCAEVRYWEQAANLQDAAALALRIWGEHRVSAGLPPWEIVGLEVVDRDTYLRRDSGAPTVSIIPAGDLRPF